MEQDHFGVMKLASKQIEENEKLQFEIESARLSLNRFNILTGKMRSKITIKKEMKETINKKSKQVNLLFQKIAVGSQKSGIKLKNALKVSSSDSEMLEWN